MKKVVENPEVNNLYMCNNNVYLYYRDSEGRNRWYRLSAKEVIDLYIKESPNNLHSFFNLFKNGLRAEETNNGKCIDE